ncbi:hypothetical protein BpHYR1_030651 [Brachionus plicatilis]|uniref:Uncharacterized protein n=1 Tax=Brachionus plicatilis TaxID=10195 RepID=A0A3M7Q9Q1_BRAPC|nr:hypothetical protein BpHYR1_030651 [Brachionus plicatilis]
MLDKLKSLVECNKAPSNELFDKLLFCVIKINQLYAINLLSKSSFRDERFANIILLAIFWILIKFELHFKINPTK